MIHVMALGRVCRDHLLKDVEIDLETVRLETCRCAKVY